MEAAATGSGEGTRAASTALLPLPTDQQNIDSPGMLQAAAAPPATRAASKMAAEAAEATAAAAAAALSPATVTPTKDGRPCRGCRDRPPGSRGDHSSEGHGTAVAGGEGATWDDPDFKYVQERASGQELAQRAVDFLHGDNDTIDAAMRRFEGEMR